MKTKNLIIGLTLGVGLLAQPLSGLGQNAGASGGRSSGSAVVALPAGGGAGDTNSVSAPRDPAVDVAVAFETLQVIRARAAANTNAPRVSVDQIRERTESVLDEVIKQLHAMQANPTAAPTGASAPGGGSEQANLATPVTPVLVAGPAGSRGIEERLAALEVRVNGHAQRLQEVEHKINPNR
jgi:hypothetical protein